MTRGAAVLNKAWLAEALCVARWALLGTLALLAAGCDGLKHDPGGGVTRYESPVSVTDISPDADPGSLETHGSDPGGRVVSLAQDPTQPNSPVLYAASEMAGVWKSDDAGHHWAEFNSGLTNGISIQHRQALVIDEGNPSRLIYETLDDGRVNHSGAGVWVQTKSLQRWRHVDMPPCNFQPTPAGAAFVSGQAFVATDCGVAVSADPDMAAGSWSWLQGLPFPPSQYALAALRGSDALYACRGNQLYRSMSHGTAGSWATAELPGGCFGLAVTPDDSKKVVVIHQAIADGQMAVSVVDLDAATGQQVQPVGPNIVPVGCSGSFGSGAASVFVARNPSSPAGNGAGVSYTLIAADGCRMYAYTPSNQAPASWAPISGVHDDTWSVLFPPTFDPRFFGNCVAYLSNDGGVFAHWDGCDMATGWQRAMSGLHVMYSDVIGGFSRPHDQCPGPDPCPALYLPVGDNDVWVTMTGGVPGRSWLDLGADLGDGAEVLVDPALNSQILAVRNGNYKLVASNAFGPPRPGATMINITPPNPSDGGSPPSLGNLAEVMTLKGESPALLGDYLAVESPGAPAKDIVVRNTGGTARDWVNVAPADTQGFGPGQIGAIGVSGGHSRPVIYVLTSPNADYSSTPSLRGPGEVWRSGGDSTAPWVKASAGLSKAYNLYVDPYNSNFAYVTDLGDSTIKSTSDGGQSWHVERALTDLATNYGEFVFDCGAPGRSGGPIRTSALAWSCPLQSVVFDREHPNIRVASLWFGGVVLSRDGGRNWIPLLVTNNDLFDDGPPEFAFSLFYDSEPSPSTGHPSLYMGLLGKSMRRVDGPLLSVATGQVEICPICGWLFGFGTKRVVLVLDSLNMFIPLTRDARGTTRASFLLDATKITSMTYHFEFDGRPTAKTTHVLSKDEIESGAFPVTLNIVDQVLRLLGWLIPLVLIAWAVALFGRRLLRGKTE